MGTPLDRGFHTGGAHAREPVGHSVPSALTVMHQAEPEAVR